MPPQNTGSMLCPSCRKLISVSAERCPYCGARRPGMYGYGPAVSRALRSFDPVWLIPRACIALYVLSLILDLRSALSMSGSIFGLLGPGSRALAILGWTYPGDLVGGRPWTVLTAIYLHGGILHIAFNLLWVRNLAPEVQRGFGPARFFVIWTVAGALGFFLSDLLPLLGLGSAHPSIGASGSIFGLMGALIVYGRRIGASMMTRQVWQWALIIGVLGFLMPGVDSIAHVGGFVGGLVSAQLLAGGIGRPDSPGVTIAALAMLAATGLGFVANIAGYVLHLLG